MFSIAEQQTRFRAALAEQPIFDCNVWYDPLCEEGFVPYDSLDAMLADCEAHGIGGGIVTDRQAAVLDNYTGNARLEKWLAGRKNWYGCMVLTPDVSFLGAERYIRDRQAAGFRAAAMFPRTFEHSMQPFAVGELLDILQRERIPLMLWHDQVGWDTVDALCSRYPQLPVILRAHTVKFLYYARQYLALLRTHDHLYMESHNLVLPRELETIWALTGKMHVLYGSYMPAANPDFASYRVLNADIPPAARDAILFGNAAALFGLGKEDAK